MLQRVNHIRSSKSKYFIIIYLGQVSTALAERFKTLNEKLIGSKSGDIDWREFRETYATLSFLVKKVDNHLGPIMILSFSNNLYFICLQLFNGIS